MRTEHMEQARSEYRCHWDCSRWHRAPGDESSSFRSRPEPRQRRRGNSPFSSSAGPCSWMWSLPKRRQWSRGSRWDLASVNQGRRLLCPQSPHRSLLGICSNWAPSTLCILSLLGSDSLPRSNTHLALSLAVSSLSGGSRTARCLSAATNIHTIFLFRWIW